MILIPPRRMDFHDEFGVVLPSASINASNATSETGLTLPAAIGGARTAVDTETCMSIIPNVGSALATHAGVFFGDSNNRCSYADGYAWMDFPTGFNAAAHAGQGRIVVMYDGNGRAAWGFLGAVGSSETLGAEIATGTLTKGWLCVITATESNHFGAGRVIGSYFTSLGTETCDVSNKVQQVLTPSATGCLIYRDAACTVNGWHKPAAFDMNATAYTFGIYAPTSGGRLFFMGGKATPASGDPGCWKTTAVTRAAGMIAAFKVSPIDVTKSTSVGFDTNTSGALEGNSIRINADTLFAKDGTTEGPVALIPVDNTDYILCVILRAAGAQYFVKQGTGYFRRVWSSSVNNTATLYVGKSAYSITGFCDWTRLPKTKWLQAPALSDSFTGSAGSNDNRVADGAGHAETTGLGSGGAIAWSSPNGAIDGSGALVITPTAGIETQIAVNLNALASPDVEIAAISSRTSADIAHGVVWGLDSKATPANYGLTRFDGAGNLKTSVFVAGTEAVIASVATTFTDARELKVWQAINPATGFREIHVYFETTTAGVPLLIGSFMTLTAPQTTATNGLYAGLFATDPSAGFSNAKMYSIGSNNEHMMLNSLIGDFPVATPSVYGVRWNTVGDTMTGVSLVNGLLIDTPHTSYPVQELMKRCVLEHTTGAFKYYLDPTDSTKKLDGTASVLTGADGNVMVQIPKFYYLLLNDLNYMTALISLDPFSFTKADGTVVAAVVHPIFYSGGLSTPAEYKYCSAYEGVLYRSAAYVDGDTTQTYSAGDKIRSVSGYFPLSYFNRTERRQAIDGAFYQYDYWMNEALILLYLTRFKSWNSQTMLPGYTEGSTWNITKRCKTGVTNVLGNACGSIKYGVAGANRCAFAYADTVVVANSFYGIENFYGHLWKWVDGINIEYIGAPLTEAKVYISNNPAQFADDTATNHTALGIDLPLVSGYQKSVHPGTLLPSAAVGWSSSIFITDYFYASSVAGWRALCAGGSLDANATAGVACRLAAYAASNRNAYFAGRAAA